MQEIATEIQKLLELNDKWANCDLVCDLPVDPLIML